MLTVQYDTKIKQENQRLKCFRQKHLKKSLCAVCLLNGLFDQINRCHYALCYYVIMFSFVYTPKDDKYCLKQFKAVLSIKVLC